jgi:hypothetical protein
MENSVTGKTALRIAMERSDDALISLLLEYESVSNKETVSDIRSQDILAPVDEMVVQAVHDCLHSEESREVERA